MDFKKAAEYLREYALKHNVEIITVKAPPLKYRGNSRIADDKIIIIDYIGRIKS